MVSDATHQIDPAKYEQLAWSEYDHAVRTGSDAVAARKNLQVNLDLINQARRSAALAATAPAAADPYQSQLAAGADPRSVELLRQFHASRPTNPNGAIGLFAVDR